MQRDHDSRFIAIPGYDPIKENINFHIMEKRFGNPANASLSAAVFAYFITFEIKYFEFNLINFLLGIIWMSIQAFISLYLAVNTLN